MTRAVYQGRLYEVVMYWGYSVELRHGAEPTIKVPYREVVIEGSREVEPRPPADTDRHWRMSRQTKRVK